METDDGRRRTIGTCDDDSGLSDYQRRQRECCPPQLFTSILLGILACVLVTGGVFLAFHKWDHTWLLVSAVGVILMAIGTALHCCSSEGDNMRKHVRCKGGCGSARSKPDVLSNGGGAMLTEQLLPLSNARSVSQLSLNMLPGYFPPLVFPAAGSPYGLEQHAAVVQNINKLVQHHQQLHFQTPTAAQNDSKSFILLPLPVDANATNIQNIVAAVCQLDTNTQHASTDALTEGGVTSELPGSQTIHEATTDQPVTTTSQSAPIFKHVEVQTCSDWGRQSQRCDNATSNCAVIESTSPPLESREDVEASHGVPTTLESERTEELPPSATLIPIELASLQNAADQGVPPINATENSVCDIAVAVQQEISIEFNDIYDVPSLIQSIALPIETFAESYTQDTSRDAIPFVNNECTATNSVVMDDNNTSNVCEVALVSSENTEVITVISNDSETNIIIPNITVECSGAANVSLVDEFDVSVAEMDSQLADSSDLESELLERSSPPPSYDDVTQDSSNPPLNGFSSAYGTM